MSELSNPRGLPLLAAALVLGALAAGCGSSSSAGEADLTGDAYPGIDLANTRQAKSTIESGNVGQLQEAWSLPIEGQGVYGSYASTPVIVNGVVYSQDLESNVQALDLESGDVLWSRKIESPSHGPNGLAVAEGHVYGTTNSGAFALDQRTGKELWSTPLGGPVDMQPATDDGRVYVSTVPENTSAEYEAGGSSTPCRRGSGATRRSTRAAVSGTRPPSTPPATSTPAPATRRRCRGRRTIPGARAAQATTAMRTRWSSSIRRPAS
jgi:hypothetical protein